MKIEELNNFQSFGIKRTSASSTLNLISMLLLLVKCATVTSTPPKTHTYINKTYSNTMYVNFMKYIPIQIFFIEITPTVFETPNNIRTTSMRRCRVYRRK